MYREAIERLGRCRMALDLAPGHLVDGEWLRREHRCIDARGHRRTAQELFAARCARSFGERAAPELLATSPEGRLLAEA